MTRGAAWPLAFAALLVVSSAGAAASDRVQARVKPVTTLAGERIMVSARVVPSGRRCRATISRAGSSPVRLPARRAVKGTVSWPWALPPSARSGTGTARVSCQGAGSDDARFVVRALPAGDPVTGKTVFLLNCGGCHTLADGGTQGTSLDLDSAMPSYEKTVDRVINGKGLMPPFKTRLTPAQIADVSEYVSSVAGK